MYQEEHTTFWLDSAFTFLFHQALTKPYTLISGGSFSSRQSSSLNIVPQKKSKSVLNALK